MDYILLVLVNLRIIKTDACDFLYEIMYYLLCGVCGTMVLIFVDDCSDEEDDQLVENNNKEGNNGDMVTYTIINIFTLI